MRFFATVILDRKFFNNIQFQVVFYTKEGVKLAILCETLDQISVVRSHPKQDYIAIACNDGCISMVQIAFMKVLFRI